MPDRDWKTLLARGWWSIPVIGACIVVIASLASAQQAGFPLDDSWIHQDFARTLASTGRFAYLPGHSGAGSTSPLWVLLLLPPYWFTHANPPVWLLTDWSALLGGVALAGIGIVAGALASDLTGQVRFGREAQFIASIVAGLACVMEWHLGWAAMSGMETDLFALVALTLLLASHRRMHPVGLGLLTALALTIRPEGVLVGAIVILGTGWAAVSPRSAHLLTWRRSTGSRRAISPADLGRAARDWWNALETRRLRAWSSQWLLPFALTAVVGALPYVLINYLASGHLFPSTLYAKSTFFTVGNFAQAVIVDLGGVATSVIGSSPLVLLLGALSYSHWLLTHGQHRTTSLASQVIGDAGGSSAGGRGAGSTAKPEEQQGEGYPPLRWMLWLWSIGLVLGYAGHGVETSLHGRYLMPMLPALIALGAAGAAPLLVSQRHRLIGAIGGMLLVGAGVFSCVRGVQIYSANVRFINATQVAAATWLRVHAPAGAVIATHDIGAIGYFSGHGVIDIAGLADPELIPLLNDQPALEAYLRSRHVAYVAIYTNWFPDPNSLVHDLASDLVYRTPGNQLFVIYQTHW